MDAMGMGKSVVASVLTRDDVTEVLGTKVLKVWRRDNGEQVDTSTFQCQDYVTMLVIDDKYWLDPTRNSSFTSIGSIVIEKLWDQE